MTKVHFILLSIFCFVFTSGVSARRTRSNYKTSYKPRSTYKQKSIFAGYGKKSSVNGRIKTKAVSGYFKKSNGYKFVNSYSRSY